MKEGVTELELPLGGTSGELARGRVEHLRRIIGDDPTTILRLVAAFRTLGAVYAASEAELARVVGPISAARIRWFLDAPLATSLDIETRLPFADAA
ncbi:MAG TPA: hypothetical protein VEK76_14035 [Candidatus Binatia bacterium]|nr:hypothetical protein [Candidatus Binatia bacterium]